MLLVFTALSACDLLALYGPKQMGKETLFLITFFDLAIALTLITPRALARIASPPLAY